jgi:ribonuclease P protein component
VIGGSIEDGSYPVAFPKAARLLKPADFQQVFDCVDCKQGGTFFTFLSRSNTLDRSRLGLVIAKRHAQKAVSRNKIKRCLRESFRLNYPTLAKLELHFDLIVLIKPGTDQLDKQHLRLELEKQWSKFINKRQALLPK